MDELCHLSATAPRQRIVRGDLSPVEVTRAVLERAERLQSTLNCFITIYRDEAMAEARAAEQALMRGDASGLLHGIPYSCKDLVNTRGVRTTYGSKLFARNLPGQDAATRLKRNSHCIASPNEATCVQVVE